MHTMELIIHQVAGNLYWKDMNSRYLGCNNNMARLFNLKNPADIIGKSDYDFFKDRKYVKKIVENDQFVIKVKKEMEFEEKITNEKGQLLIYKTKKSPLRDKNNNIIGIIGISIDITKEKQAAISKDFIINNTVGNLYWKDLKGRYLGCNKAFSDMIGLNHPKDIVGRTDMNLFSTKMPLEKLVHLVKTDQEIMNSNTEKTLLEEGIDDIGNPSIYLTKKIPFHDLDGKVIGIMGTSINITKEKQAEMAKSDFISNMEHDLRSPFTGISGIATTLYEIEEDSEKKEMLKLLVQSCTQWEKTQHHILAALSTKEPQLVTKEQFSLRDELTSIKDALSATAYLKKLTISIEIIPSKLDVIETDRLKFRLIMSSLVGNAINFTEQGSVRIIANCNDKNWIIQVIDTGIGIPNDKLDYIFEQFTKLSRSNKHGSNFKGVGLGLYISQHMAKQLEGAITVSSQVGKGSTFSFTLPCGAKTR